MTTKLPNVLDVALMRGEECVAAGALLEAIQAYDFVLTQAPHCVDALEALAELYAHEIAFRCSDDDTCLRAGWEGTKTSLPFPLPTGFDAAHLGLPPTTPRTATNVSVMEVYQRTAAQLLERLIHVQRGTATAGAVGAGAYVVYFNLAELNAELYQRARFSLPPNDACGTSSAIGFPSSAGAVGFWKRACTAYEEGLRVLVDILPGACRGGDEEEDALEDIPRRLVQDYVEACVSLVELHLQCIQQAKEAGVLATLTAEDSPEAHEPCPSPTQPKKNHKKHRTNRDGAGKEETMNQRMGASAELSAAGAEVVHLFQRGVIHAEAALRYEAVRAAGRIPCTANAHRVYAWLLYELSEWKKEPTPRTSSSSSSCALHWPSEPTYLSPAWDAVRLRDAARTHAVVAARQLLGEEGEGIAEERMPSYGTRLDLCRLLGQLGEFAAAWRLTLDLHLADDANVDVWELLSELRWRAGDPRHALDILKYCLQCIDVPEEEQGCIVNGLANLSQQIQEAEGLTEDEVKALLQEPVEGNPLQRMIGEGEEDDTLSPTTAIVQEQEEVAID